MNTFTQKTFTYFDGAKKNKNNEKWFLKNKELYLEHVREPFEVLLQHIHQELATDLPRIRIDSKQVTRPVRPKNRATNDGLIKPTSYVTLWEKKTSLFEWNPGAHIQFGSGKKDNLYAIGLYMTSSRQLSRLRGGLVDDFDRIHTILQKPQMKKTWGGLLGEKYKRFPKNFDETDPSAQYLWHKQFYLAINLNRKEVMAKNLKQRIVKDLRTAMPFFKWVRETVGTYSR